MSKKYNFHPRLAFQDNSTLKGVDSLVVAVDTRGTGCINGKTIMFSLNGASKAKATYLAFEGFNVLEFDQESGKYLINGKVYLVLEQTDTEKHLIADIKYDVTSIKPDYTAEAALVSDVNAKIKNDWNDSFDLALKMLLNPVDQYQQKSQIEKQQRGGAWFYFKKPFSYISNNKGKVILPAIISVLVLLNLAQLFGGKNNQQADAVSLLSAEAMAKQQDEILDKAFSDIGIDRNKLSSDISCFTE